MMQLDVLNIWPDWKATRLIGEGGFGKVCEMVRNNFGIEKHSASKVITIPAYPAELQSVNRMISVCKDSRKTVSICKKHIYI